MRNLIAVGQMVPAYVQISARKIRPLAYRFPTSLEDIGTDTDRSATYDFLLVIHSNDGPISYRFRD